MNYLAAKNAVTDNEEIKNKSCVDTNLLLKEFDETEFYRLEDVIDVSRINSYRHLIFGDSFKWKQFN